MDKDLTGKLSLLENRVKILESDNEKKTEENGILRNIIYNIQKSLNKQDSCERSLNVIISGIREGVIEIKSTGDDGGNDGNDYHPGN